MLVNNPIKILTRVQHLAYKSPLSLDMYLRNIIFQFLIATTYSHHRIITSHFTVASTCSDKKERARDIYDWNCDIHLLYNSLDMLVNYFAFAWIEMEWTSTEYLIPNQFNLMLYILIIFRDTLPHVW
jgi:hypothetical protein